MSTPRYAVFGHPIAHSLSPKLHALFAAQRGVALEYTTIDAEPAKFGAAVTAFFDGGGKGANVTLPHKAAAFALANVRTETACRLQVANVLTPLPDGGLEADSNDGAGLLADLRQRHGVDPHGLTVLLLGAGGAARAAAVALLDAGVAALTIVNRTPARAASLAGALAGRARVGVVAWQGLAHAAPFDLIVNATSAGVHHAQLLLPRSIAGTRTFAYDLSYGDAAKAFTDWADEAGCAGASDGLGMLVETAATSFLHWHGVRPDTDAALRALPGVRL